MKKLLLIAILVCTTTVILAQDIKQQQPQTKMDVFSSKTGSIVKFINSHLPAISASYGTAETRIRKVMRGTEAMYFYQIEKAGKYGSKTASIEYLDLLEVIKAFQVLKKELEADVALNPDYLENKFTTADGFQLGYYVDKGLATWYLQLEKYGSDNIIFVKDYAIIETALNNAKSKIEELKAN